MSKESISAAGVFSELALRQERREPCALVLLVESQGSVPAKTGAKMLVSENGTLVGTIGGGTMEKEAIEHALQAMVTGKPITLHIDLSAPPDYVCGGSATLYIEPIVPPCGLIIAGAGHVGQTLCKVAAYAGFAVTVVDDRSEFIDPAILPDAHRLLTADFATMFTQLEVNASTYIVCATRGHAHDYTVIRQALATAAPYVGLVGSRSKRSGFLQRLQEEDGFNEEELTRLYTPVGLNIGAVSPPEIAVSITAELIRIRSNNGHEDGFDSARGWGLPTYGQPKTTAAHRG